MAGVSWFMAVDRSTGVEPSSPDNQFGVVLEEQYDYLEQPAATVEAETQLA
jgi:hypothetical protein